MKLMLGMIGFMKKVLDETPELGSYLGRNE